MTKGFSLIELLVVIAIVAVLAVAVVLVLNPAELIKQGRDATRISDLGTINSALSYYLSTATNPDTSFGVSGFICRNTTNTSSTFTAAGACTINATRGISGAGWVAVKLDDASGGSPLGSLPADPLGTADFGYPYLYAGNGSESAANANTFELNARLESTKYRPNMVTDGGNKPATAACVNYQDIDCWYEAGTKLDL